MCVCVCICSTEISPWHHVVFADGSESGELDLEGIDDQEIEKVWTCFILSITTGR